LNIHTIKISDINTASYNPRIINKEEFEGLKNSLKIFGQQENFIVNRNMTLISGHQRLEAAKMLGWSEVTVNIVDLSSQDEKKLNLIMNSTAIQGRFDELKLNEILEELKLTDYYEELNLNKLEPLDLSETVTDDTFETPEEYYIKVKFDDASNLEEALAEISEIVDKYNGSASINSN
jgi:hypothetical protein